MSNVSWVNVSLHANIAKFSRDQISGAWRPYVVVTYIGAAQRWAEILENVLQIKIQIQIPQSVFQIVF